MQLSIVGGEGFGVSIFVGTRDAMLQEQGTSGEERWVWVSVCRR